ncbi:MAG: peptidylprolyl isomerase [Arachnia propionica]|nr:MAG: peptidylprolyl isomerase [Arachnia propionica]
MHFSKTSLLLSAALFAGAMSLSACSAEETPAEPSAAPSSAAAVAEDAASPTPAEASPTPSPVPAVAPSSDLEALQVSEGEIPEVSIPTPWGIDQTRTKVLRPGGEQLLTKTSVVTLNYTGINARTGKVFDSSYERGEPATFPLQNVIPGFAKGLEGQAVGSRVLIAIPSEDGYSTGNEAAGIAVGDTIVFVVDIISANLQEATGKAVAAQPGLPTVQMQAGKPELSFPDSPAPTELRAQPIIKGDRAEVTAGAEIQVKYRVWVWETKEMVQDAWVPQRGKLDGLVEGWQQGLVGQTVGSRVLLVVPPELGYPEGSPELGVKAGQTLVFVIDILDATANS